MEVKASHAFTRFGLGRRGAASAPDDVRQWLTAQLDLPDPLLTQTEPSIRYAIRTQHEYERAIAAKVPPKAGLATVYQEEMVALLEHAVTSDLSVRERLVWFWSNHFTVSARAGNWIFGFLGPFVHEAIRPHVTGRFADILKAVMRHPAMLFYLDNWISVGPDSPRGRSQHLGINENLARECLELHTLGVKSGYTQRDVTTLAEILTGRTFSRDEDSPGFVFRADMHQPGVKTLFGHTIRDGLQGSDDALDLIANHPATRRHIATQLVQHYIADVPPERCIDRLIAVLDQTEGDLKQATLAIMDLPEAWQPLTKFRAPVDYTVAVQRALDIPLQPGPGLLAATRELGQPFMAPLLPNGWPDTAADWISGEALLKRADWALTQASRPGAPSADAVIEATIADVCSISTLRAVRSCSTPAEALATVFASPEFMRR